MQVVGTAGHVDHGKSTLVQALTGIDPDRFAEEKRRGLTIDLGFAWLALPSGVEVGLIDVPGHERFIKNMLAGAGGMAVCLFVVAANEGWMPQSSEHLAIVDLLGMSGGVIALTKADLVDVAEVAAVTESVRAHVVGTVLEGAPVVACSAATGVGLDELVAALDAQLALVGPPADAARPRLWVDRVFTIAGAGTVVTGTLTGGSLAVGDHVEISPAARRARIRTIQSHKREVISIGPGNRVALNLAGLEREGAERGDATVGAGQWRPTRVVDVKVRVLPEALAGRTHDLTTKGSYLLYAGSAEVEVRVKLVGSSRIAPGELGYARLHLARALPLARADRFVLRDAGRILTLGGGQVLDPLPNPATKPVDEHVALLRALDGATAEQALAAIVGAEQRIGETEAYLRTATPTAPLSAGARTGDVPGARGDIAGAVDVPGVARLGDWLVSQAHLDELNARLHDALDAHHAAHPLEQGLARADALAAVGTEPDIFDALVERDDAVVAKGAFLRLRSHSVSLRPEEDAARRRLVDVIEAGDFAPPLAHELDADPALLRALTDAGELVRIGDFFLTRAQAEEARAKVRARIEESGGVTVADIRDLLGTTRKYAVPLCEWLDATGATIRRGDLRILGPRSML